MTAHRRGARLTVVSRAGVRAVAGLAAISALAVLAAACAQVPPNPEPTRSAPAVAGQRPVLEQWAGQVADVAWAGDASLAVVTRSGDVLRVDPSDGSHRMLDRIGDGAARVAADPASGVIVVWQLLSGETVAWNADGTRLGTYDLGFAGVGDLAVREGGDRFAVVGGTVSVIDVATGDVLSRGERPTAPDAVSYNSVAYRGDTVLAFPGADFALDTWAVAGPLALLTSEDCGCDYHRHALDPAAGPSAFATLVGALILWDPAGNRAIAKRSVISSPDESVDPLAVVRDRYVLYVVDRPVGNGETESGPLMAWDTRTDSVSEVWACPDCTVRGVRPRPGSDEILIEGAAANGDDQWHWIVTLAL
jgi:hypothetical protein